MNKKVLFKALILILFFGVDTNAQTINRGPYLQSVTTGSIFIKWRTTTATASKVWYGSSPGNLTNQVNLGGSTTDHEVQITGLSANTTYYYAVGYGGTKLAGDDADHYFNTSPPTSTSQTIRAWVLGNAGHKDHHQRDVRDAFYNYIGSNHIDMMLLLGDNAYDAGTDADYQLAWFENMYEARLINSVMWSCFGNHDGDSADSETETGPYYDIFTFPRNAEAGGVASGTEAYYSFDYGNIHFISINTWDIDRDPGEPMITWVQNDLNATSQDWIVALFHHPPYTGNNGNSSDDHPIESDMREDFLSILEAGGVDLVLSSHHHSYQRSFLINGHYDVSSTWNPNTMGLDLGDGRTDGDNAYYKEIDGTGTVYMVAGSAGDVGSDPAGYPTMYEALQEYGSVILEVTDLQMDVKFIQDNDNIGDYFTIIKQENPPTVDITSPIDGHFFGSPQGITINASASDPGGSVQNVEFFINDVSIGFDASSPYTKNYTFSSNGNYEIKAIATDNSGNVAISKIMVRVGGGTVCEMIDKSSNDAEEDSSGNVNRTSGDIELVNDGGNQVVGLRFENLNIPQGAVIEDAYIQFTSKNDDNENPRKLDIYGEDSDFPFLFGTNDDNISDRTKTSAMVSWYPDYWTGSNQSGSDQRTIQIRSIIQEIVDRPGFSMNSPISIIIEGYGMRVAKSFDGDEDDAPELCIEFSNCTDTDGDGTCDGDEICGNGNLEPGDPCDDGNPGTYNDLIQGNCDCEGIAYDCPSLELDIGDPCDDNDSGTYNDIVNSSCNCVGTQYDCYPNDYDIGDPCNDGDPGTYNDVYVGPAPCNCVGTSYDCPSLQADFGDPCDDGDSNTYNDEVDATCNCAGITPGGSITMTTSSIASGDNDAEQKISSGSVNTSSSDLEMILDGSDEQIVGLRFSGLNIDQAMYIQSAMIQFTADGSDNDDPCVLEIYGHDIDDAPVFTTSSNNISNRAKTSAKKVWLPDNWSNGQRGTAQKTVNIAPVIQEIVNRPGYTASSDIALIIEGTGKRKAYSYNGDPANVATLTVIYDLNGPLPVELLDVSANLHDHGVKVDWTTASEENNDYFTVERSIDGRNFEALGNVQGQGTTSEINKYSFLDKAPKRGLNYYRIKQTDFDGKFSHSSVVSVNFESEDFIDLFPSVVNESVNIVRGGEQLELAKVNIHDITGKVFKSSEIQKNETEISLDLTDLISGVYFISINNDITVKTFKIVKL